MKLSLLQKKVNLRNSGTKGRRKRKGGGSSLSTMTWKSPIHGSVSSSKVCRSRVLWESVDLPSLGNLIVVSGTYSDLNGQRKYTTYYFLEKKAISQAELLKLVRSQPKPVKRELSIKVKLIISKHATWRSERMHSGK